MDRYPYGTPPRMWSPRPHKFWFRFWKPFRRYQQRCQHRIRRIDVVGLEHVKKAISAERGVLIATNHAGHGDCYLLLEALGRLPSPSYIMTAWQVFQMMRRWQQIAYCQHGCFSVNREGRDIAAFRRAVKILAETSYPLVIFPEGEVYHLNDRVTPFRDGTTMIASTAVRRAGRPVACVPCALKYYYLDDPTIEVAEVVERIEQRLQIAPAPDLSLSQRVERLQLATLHWRERQYGDSPAAAPHATDSPSRTDDERQLEYRAELASADKRRDRLADQILSRLERDWDMEAGQGSVPERAKRLRNRLIGFMESSESWTKGAPEAEAALEDVFVAVQLYSYSFDYISQSPTIERIAETVDKLEEDVLGARTAGIRGTRRGTIAFGPPIVVATACNRDADHRLADELRCRVQKILDGLQKPV
jgi:1-acyl-sn-glycerol-3-phosphate acyltransferase